MKFKEAYEKAKYPAIQIFLFGTLAWAFCDTTYNFVERMSAQDQRHKSKGIERIISKTGQDCNQLDLLDKNLLRSQIANNYFPRWDHKSEKGRQK